MIKFKRKKNLAFLFILLLSNCAAIVKLDVPSDEKPSRLILPISLQDNAQYGQHGFYYQYKIVDKQGVVSPYIATIKLPLKDNMLIVDALPPGDYSVTEFKFLTEGSGDFTHGNNVQARNDQFSLESGKITIFPQSLDVQRRNEHPGRGMSTIYSFKVNPLSDTHREQVTKTLKSIETFDSWQIRAE